MTDALLARIVRASEESLGDGLTGVYLHGSLAGGGFRWEAGDIDLLAVVRRAPAQREKEALIRALMLLERDAPPKGIEMSVVRAEVLRPLVHPTPFELHYSPTHRAKAAADLSAYCRDMHGDDPDLAAHAAMTRHAGRVLAGAPIGSVFGEVPRAAMLDSIRCDLDGAETAIAANPVYLTLNLCRAVAYVRHGLLLTKAEGGAWALAHLPEAHHGCIRAALDAYTSGAPVDPALPWQAFARFGLSAIGA